MTSRSSRRSPSSRRATVLRLTLTTSDTPHLLPSPGQAANLAGGIYMVQRNADAASYLEVPVARPDAFEPCTLCR
jgi:hypothetical protein